MQLFFLTPPPSEVSPTQPGHIDSHTLGHSQSYRLNQVKSPAESKICGAPAPHSGAPARRQRRSRLGPA
jgi:hypothetical protein